jgi:hypothetical protein
MNKLIYNSATGEIIAEVLPSQDLDAFRSNWGTLPTALLDVEEGFQLTDYLKRYQYKVDLETLELIAI